MGKKFVAKQTVMIQVSIEKVWDALVNPDMIRQYMFGTNTVSDWKEGHSIVWEGEWQGKKYKDKGVILRIEPERVVQYTHFSPLTGLVDEPENYHTVTVELSDEGNGTRLSLSQDNNPTEQAREHSEKNWAMVLNSIKEILEK